MILRPPITKRTYPLFPYSALLRSECGTDARLARTFVRQQVFGVGPAHVLLADEILHRNANVREEHLVDLMLTFERYNRSHLHARRLHVDQEEGDARLLLALCRCTHQAEAHVGILGECGDRKSVEQGKSVSVR